MTGTIPLIDRYRGSLNPRGTGGGERPYSSHAARRSSPNSRPKSSGR